MRKPPGRASKNLLKISDVVDETVATTGKRVPIATLRTEANEMVIQGDIRANKVKNGSS